MVSPYCNVDVDDEDVDVDVEDVEEMLEEAHRDPEVEVIIFDFDSPGGTVTGVPELAARIRACEKRTVGWTCKQSCSASMWLMSQCDEVYVSPSSVVGSIGVYIAMLDESKALELEGIADEDLRIERLVELNVAEQVHNLAELSFVQLAWKRRQQPTLHGWVYDIHTGRLKTVTKMEPGHPLDPIYSYEFPEE